MTPELPEVLPDELAALGRAVRVPEPDDLFVDAVMARLPAAPARRRGPGRGARRWVTAVAAAVLLGVLAAPPVRAQLGEWLEFAGVRVRLGPLPASSAPPSSTPPSPAPPSPAPPSPAPPSAAAATVSPARAQSLVAFRVRFPAAFGVPQAVEVSADRRVVSATWATPSGPVRLDQFDGRLDYVFAKRAAEVEWTTVRGEQALWFPRPHEVVVLDGGGSPRTEPPRLAGRTLVWESAGVTLRLEGDLRREQAVAIANSLPR